MEKIGTWGNTEEPKLDQTAAPLESGASLVKIGTFSDKVETPEPYKKYQAQITESGNVDDAMSVSKGDLEWALMASKGISPDEAADVKRLSSSLNLPKDTAQRNLSEIKDLARSREILQKLTEIDKDGKPVYPKTLAWLSNPESMRIAKDDVETLQKLEKQLNEKTDGIVSESYRAAVVGAANINKAISNIPALAMGIAIYPFNKASKTLGLGEPFKVSESIVKNKVAEYFKDIANNYGSEALNKNIVDQAIKGDYAGAAKTAYLQVVEQIPNLALLFVTGGAAQAAGASVAISEALSLSAMGVQEASTSFTDKITEGKSESSALENSMLRGIAEGVFEKYTLDIFKGIAKQAQGIGKDGIKEIVKRTAGDMFKNFVKEGKSEAYTSIAQDLADVVTGDKVELSDMAKNAVNAWVVGGFMGAGVTAGSAPLVERARRAQYDLEHKSTQEAIKIVEASKLKDRDAEALSEFIKTKVGDANIYVPHDAVLQLQQKDGEGFDEWAKLFKLNDQLDNAAATGADIVIPKADWIAKVPNSEFAKKLMSDVRYDLHGYSERESQAKEALKSNIEDMQKDYATLQAENELPVQVANIREQLITPKDKGGFGFSAEDADASLSIMLSGAKQLSKKRGESVQSWFDRVNPTLNIGGTYQGNADLQQADIVKNAPATYFKMQKTIEDKVQGKTATVEQIKGLIKDIKPEEIQYSGINKFLEGKDKVNKQELLNYLGENQIQVKDVILGINAHDAISEANNYQGAPKFSAYKLPGGENYREVLFTLPTESSENQKLLSRLENEFISAIVEIKSQGEMSNIDPKDLALQVVSREVDASELDPRIKGIGQKLLDAYEKRRSGKDQINDFTSSHFDEKNILAHVRLDDRIDSEGNKVLFVEEIQSDWHQKGRDKGYKLNEEEKSNIRKEIDKNVNKILDREDNLKSLDIELKAKERELAQSYGFDVLDILEMLSRKELSQQAFDDYLALTNKYDQEKIMMRSEIKTLREANIKSYQKIDSDYLKAPDAPLKKNWQEYAFKRILRMSAEQGFDKVAWTTGDQQAKRYKGALLKEVDDIAVRKNADGSYNFEAQKDNNTVIQENNISANRISDLVGKSLGAQLIQGADNSEAYGKAFFLTGGDFNVGGEGMRGFYDKILVNFADKYLKKFGVKTTESKILSRLSEEEAYEGPSKTLPELEEILKSDELSISSKRQIKDLITAIKENPSADFKALATENLENLGAKAIGGKFTKLNYDIAVHSVAITPEMRKSLLEEGQSFFQKQDENVRGAVTFEKSRTLINLFETANFSTLLHETSHILFNDMQILVQSGNADEQTVKDFEALKEFVGGDIKSVDAQEKLARAFELYLREGKAPSVKLASAFSKFRAWLTAIYKTIKDLGKIKIGPELSAVFDRMLASEQEISEAQMYYGAKKNLAELLGLDEKGKSDYQEKKQAAQGNALDKQVKKVMSAYFKAIGGRKEFFKLATSEVEQMPIYKIMDDLRTYGGFLARDIERIAGGQALAEFKAKHPDLIFNENQPELIKTIKGKSYIQIIKSVSKYGIHPDSLRPYLPKGMATREYGILSALSKNGRPIDLLAIELHDLGYLSSEDPQELVEKLISKAVYIPDGEQNFDRGQEPANIAEIAMEHDYNAPDELIEDIIKSRPKTEAIKIKTDEMVKAKEAELRDELSKQETIPGEESIHNDKSFALLLAEYEMLRQKLLTDKKAEGMDIKRLEAKIYRDAAQDMIDKKNVIQAGRYDLYAKAEQRYANESYELAKKGELIAAHEAKKKQILNHALVQAAIKAKNERLEIEKFYKTKNLKTKLKGVENDYASAALDLIKNFGLNDNENIDIKGPGIKNLSDLDEVLFSMIPEWVLSQGSDYKTLSLSQVRALDEAIQSIIHYGRNELKAIELANVKSVEDFVNLSAERMGSIRPKKVYEEGTAKRYISDKLRSIGSELSQVEFIFEVLDGFSFEKDKIFGPLRKAFKAGVKSEDKFKTLQRATLEKADTHWKTLYAAKKRLEENFGGNKFSIEGVPVSEDMKREGRFRWDAERLIAIMLNTGNVGNAEALQVSYNLRDDQIKQIAKLFTASELEAIQGIWDVTETLFPALDDVHFRIYNRHLDKVLQRTDKYTSADGKEVELAGGYYPLQFDHALNLKVEDQKGAKDAAKEDIMKNRQSAVFRKTKPEDGMTYSRTGSKLPPNLSLDVWFGHVLDTTRYIAYAEYMRDLNRIVNNKDWATTAISRVGRTDYQAIKKWVSYLALPERTMPSSGFERFLDYQRRMGSMHTLGLNLRSSIKQTLATFNAATDIGWGHIAKAISEVKGKTFVESSKTWQDILKLSPYLRARSENIDREMSDVLNRMSPGAKRFEIAGQSFTWKDVQDFNFSLMEASDRMTIGVCWKAAFNKYLEENISKDMSEKERIADAVEKADSTISSTQPSSLPLDLSNLQRSEGAIRVFVSFMSGTLKYGNRLMAKTRAYKEGAINSREYFNFILNETLLFGWADMLITSFLVGGALPDWWEWITGPVNTLLGWIPFARDASSILEFNRSAGKTPAVAGIDLAAKAAKTTYSAAKGDAEWTQALFDIGRAAEFQTGVPALRLVKDAKHNYELITGQLENKKR